MTGFVTYKELIDILCLSYPELLNKNLMPIVQKYQSIQNKLLI